MEQTREFWIHLYIDTNKQTIDEKFGSLSDLLDFLDQDLERGTVGQVRQWLNKNDPPDPER